MTTVDTTAAVTEKTTVATSALKIISVGHPKLDERTGRWTIAATAYLNSRPRISELHLVTLDRDTEDEARAEIANLIDVLQVLAPWGADDDVEVRIP